LLAEWTGLEPATPGVTGRYQFRGSMRVCGVFVFQKRSRFGSNFPGMDQSYSKETSRPNSRHHAGICVGRHASGRASRHHWPLRADRLMGEKPSSPGRLSTVTTAAGHEDTDRIFLGRLQNAVERNHGGGDAAPAPIAEPPTVIPQAHAHRKRYMRKSLACLMTSALSKLLISSISSFV